MSAASERTAASNSAHDVGNTHEAALRGALQAFARLPTLPPQQCPPRATPSHSRRPPPKPVTSSQSISIVPKRQGDSLESSKRSTVAVVGAQPRIGYPRASSTTTVPQTASKNHPDGANDPPEAPAPSHRDSLRVSIPIEAGARDAPEIHSPKPVRPAAAASSFEAATAIPELEHVEQQVSLNYDEANVSLVPRVTTYIDLASSTGGSEVRNALAKSPQSPSSLDRSCSLTNFNRATTSSSSGAVESNSPRDLAQRLPSRVRKVTAPVSQSHSNDSTQRINSLANAIVASSLASSRATSPAKSPGPPAPSLPRRQSDHALHYFAHFKQPKVDSRTPSPAKRMRQTLRKLPSEEEDDGQTSRRPRGHFHVRQHPNKHHEGDRKRWRDEITYNERKRYEGVWAANRDMHMRYTDDELEHADAMSKVKGSVSALVVKDVWSRSRLPEHALEEIWNLVDRKQIGRLDREEFVVGLWLVDQTLKGRKVPPKVQSSVWQSVRGIYGLKVPRKKP